MEARRYDLKIMIAEHKDLHAYLKTITEQMKYWVERGQLQRLCLVIISGNTEEVLEQWTFKVDSDRAVVEGTEYDHASNLTCSDRRGYFYISVHRAVHDPQDMSAHDTATHTHRYNA